MKAFETIDNHEYLIMFFLSFDFIYFNYCHSYIICIRLLFFFLQFMKKIGKFYFIKNMKELII